MGWKHTALSAVRRLGGLRLLDAFYGRGRVTVLAYHRIVDPDADDFVGFRGNASATPDEFEEQMAWVAEHMSPIGMDRVVASIHGSALPDRPVVVTFDDGYRDNLTVAGPILRRHGITATIFLATDHVGSSDPFWWDRAAAAFERSDLDWGRLPILGDRSWGDPHRMAVEWIAAAKEVGDGEKREAVDHLVEVLGGAGPTFDGMHLGWDDVVALAHEGWAIGAHTCSHPILTRIPAEQAADEITASIARVREEVGAPVLGFAYPNGHRGDFDDSAQRTVAEAGVPLAFSLVPGPARPSEVAADPHAVRRVYVHHGDDPVRFSAKVSGMPRLVGGG